MKKILYKYIPPDLAIIVKNRLIRFTQPGDFNDPFEFLPALSTKSQVIENDKKCFQHFKSKLIQTGEIKNESDLFNSWKSGRLKQIRQSSIQFLNCHLRNRFSQRNFIIR